MAGDRTQYWPAIEQKHGLPIDHWLGLVAELEDTRYPAQMALLQEGHGFSRTHANAVVMYARGSTSAKRVATVDGYLKGVAPAARPTTEAILAVIHRAHPDAETVIAWNQPMVKLGGDYVFGVSVQTRHILIAPWGTTALAACADMLAGYKVNKKTIQVPLDWDVDEDLIRSLVAARLAELGI